MASERIRASIQVLTASAPTKDECASCGEGMPEHECPHSLLPCGHHCNCSWIHDYCHFCSKGFGEEGAVSPLLWQDRGDQA